MSESRVAPQTLSLVETVVKTDPAVSPIRLGLVMQALRQPPWITQEKATSILGVSPRTFWRKIASGEYQIDKRRVNRKVVYWNADDVLRIKLNCA